MTKPADMDLNKCEAVAALTPPARQVHRLVLTTFVETGRAPSREEIERQARDHGLDPDPALTELVARDVLAFDQRGEIRAAYPFSPVPTAHVVTWPDGPSTYSMCAVDALGMSAMLGHPVTITSVEPDSDSVVIVEVNGDRAQWNPDTTVVLAGQTSDACCPSVDRTCGHINFFTTPHAAQQWAVRHPTLTTVVLDQHEALTQGIAQFGTLMHT